MSSPSPTPSLFQIGVLRLLEQQRAVLRDIDSGKALAEALATVARDVEGWANGQVQVRLLSPACDRASLLCALGTGPADELEGYAREVLMDHWEHAPAGEPVAVTQATGERICWSVPLHSTQGVLLGVLACYLGKPAPVAPSDVETLMMVAQTAVLAIDREAERDMSAKKRRAEELLSENEAQLRIALEAGEMGAWAMDPKTGALEWLQGESTMYGIKNRIDAFEDIPMGNYLETYVHPEDRDSVRATLGRALMDGNSHGVEYRILLPDGSMEWVEGRGARMVNAAGVPTQLVGVAVNVTKRKRAEQDLQFLAKASAELAGLVDPQSTLDRLAALAVPFFADYCVVDLLTPEGTLNRVAAAHVDPEQLKHMWTFDQSFPADHDSKYGIRAVLRSGKAQYVSEVTDEVIDDSISDLKRRAALKALGIKSYLSVPLRTHGKTLGAVSFLTTRNGRAFGENDAALAEDLASRAAVALENADLYRALSESDRAKDVFLATLSHELRNPLSAIVSGLNLLALAGDDKVRVTQYTKVMKRQAAQLTRLVDDLLDVSRISRGKVELERRTVSLNQVLESALEASRSAVEAGKHQLTIRMPDDAAVVTGDPVRLAQVFSNLVTNAAKYTNAGGRIEVSLEDAGDDYMVRVRDNGIGIAPDMLKNIFKMFAQVTHPADRSQGGMGIGLALVEGLVRLHGGKVEAFSPGLGQGSEFIVRLPRKVARDNALASEDASLFPKLEALARRRVLVVDDNVDAAMTTAEIIRVLGHDVEVVHDGLAAVSATERLQPDIVFLDIGLPCIDGYEAARRIRGLEQDVGRPALIALTGWGQRTDKERAAEAGFDQHLLKPAGLDQLTHILATY